MDHYTIQGKPQYIHNIRPSKDTSHIDMKVPKQKSPVLHFLSICLTGIGYWLYGKSAPWIWCLTSDGQAFSMHEESSYSREWPQHISLQHLVHIMTVETYSEEESRKKDKK